MTKEFTQSFPRFSQFVIDMRINKDNEDAQSGMALAIGFLIGNDMPHAAAAVGVAYERLYPNNRIDYMPPVTAEEIKLGESVTDAAHNLVYNMAEAGVVPHPWWEQEYHGLRRLLVERGRTVDPVPEETT